jgi:hypothetical protein
LITWPLRPFSYVFTYSTAAFAAWSSGVLSMAALLPSLTNPMSTGVPVAFFSAPSTSGAAELLVEAPLPELVDVELLLHAAKARSPMPVAAIATRTRLREVRIMWFSP